MDLHNGDLCPQVSPQKEEQQTNEVPSPASIADLHISDKTAASSPDVAYSGVNQDQRNQQVQGRQQKKRRLQGIIKPESSFPKPPSSDDIPPVRLSEKGLLKHYTKDKHGKIVPYNHSFYFANQTYEKNATSAVSERLKNHAARKRNFEDLAKNAENGSSVEH